jgi:hypothetical protein
VRTDLNSKALAGLSLLVILLVLIVQGGLHGFAVWNSTPALVALRAAIIAGRLPPTNRKRALFLVPSFAMLLVVAGGHLAWHFDWGQWATGSSTAALMFIFLPMWAVAVGVLSLACVALGLLVIFGGLSDPADHRDEGLKSGVAR